jgi:hypothetical protein
MRRRDFKRVLSISDLHSGNVVGLTPEKYNPQSEDNYKAYVYRRGLYEWTCNEIDKLRPIDICVADGDLIDGKGDKTGGCEQIEMSRPKQIEMASDFLNFIDAKEYYFSFGTGYHVGREDDWESVIANEFHTEADDIVTKDVNGLVMKFRHHIGGSMAPTGRATGLLRQQEWDTLWSINGEFERASVMVFGHVHYFQSFTNRFGTLFTQPALQGLGGSQLGSRRMGGIVDFGFLHFDIKGKDDWSWKAHLLTQTQAVRAGVSK